MANTEEQYLKNKVTGNILGVETTVNGTNATLYFFSTTFIKHLLILVQMNKMYL